MVGIVVAHVTGLPPPLDEGEQVIQVMTIDPALHTPCPCFCSASTACTRLRTCSFCMTLVM